MSQSRVSGSPSPAAFRGDVPRSRANIAGAAAVLLGVALAIPFQTIGLCMLLGLELLLLAFRRGVRHSWFTVFGLPAAVAAAFAGAIVWRGVDVLDGIGNALNLAVAILSTVLVAALARLSVHEVRQALLLAIACLLVIGLGLYGYEASVIGWRRLAALEGLNSLVNRNTVAALFSIGVLYSVAAISLCTGSARLWVLALLAAVTFFLMGYVNNSRGAMLGAVAGIPVVFLRSFPRATILAGALLLLVFVAGYIGGPLRSVLQHNGSLDNGRNRIWSAFLDRSREAPLLGYGIDAYDRDPGLRQQHPEIAPLYYPHSIYVDLLYASGIMGLVFWAAWFAWLAVRSHAMLAGCQPVLMGIGGALMVYVLVHGLVDLTFYTFGVPVLLIMGAGLFASGSPRTVAACETVSPAAGP